MALSPSESLVHQEQSLVASSQATPTSAQINEALRQTVWRLGRLDDEGLRLLLWEIPIETVLDFIWFMNTPKLSAQLTRNISSSVLALTVEKRAAMADEMIKDKFGTHDPDTAAADEQLAGHNSVQEVLKTLIRLEDEGQIPFIYPRPGCE